MQDVKKALDIIDAMGKPCTMPLLMLKKALKSESGEQFLLKSSEAHSQQDVLRYCEINQLKCEAKGISSHEFHYIIAQ